MIQGTKREVGLHLIQFLATQTQLFDQCTRPQLGLLARFARGGGHIVQRPQIDRLTRLRQGLGRDGRGLCDQRFKFTGQYFAVAARRAMHFACVSARIEQRRNKGP